jgi:hypothetical protein
MVNSNIYKRTKLFKRTTAHSKLLIFVAISILLVALVYAPSSTISVPNLANHGSTTCKPAGKSAAGLQLKKCCWQTTEGYPGTRKDVTYCSTCEDGGTRGMINCTEPTKQSSTTRLTDDIIARLGEGHTFEQIQPTDQGIQLPKSGDTVAPKDGGIVTDTNPPINDNNPPKNNDANPPRIDKGKKSGDSGSGSGNNK